MVSFAFTFLKVKLRTNTILVTLLTWKKDQLSIA